MTANPSPLDRVSDYYTGKLAMYGPTAKGVDWNSADSQHLRFEQFSRLWRDMPRFSLNDLGCGYGALYDHLNADGRAVDYLGVDVSSAMIEEASRRTAKTENCTFQVSSTFPRVADFCVASGIFNVKLDVPDDTWKAHILATLAEMHRASRSGFAFNCLTRYSDAERMRADLHYAEPSALFDHCTRNFSRHVALLHDYELYEFTVVVRKESA